MSLPEYEILVRLSEAPEHRLRMAMLADSVSHSRSRVTHTVRPAASRGGSVACGTSGRSAPIQASSPPSSESAGMPL